MIFVFRDNKNIIKFIAPHIQDKMRMADEHRKNVINGDISVLKEILYMIGVRYSGKLPQLPYVVDNNEPSAEEQPISDRQILDQLLDKMKAEGYQSLSPSELDFLKEYKSKHSKDTSNDETNVD